MSNATAEAYRMSPEDERKLAKELRIEQIQGFDPYDTINSGDKQTMVALLMLKDLDTALKSDKSIGDGQRDDIYSRAQDYLSACVDKDASFHFPKEITAHIDRHRAEMLAKHPERQVRAEAIRAFDPEPKSFVKTEDPQLKAAYAMLRDLKETLSQAPQFSDAQRQKLYEGARDRIAQQAERGSYLAVPAKVREVADTTKAPADQAQQLPPKAANSSRDR